MAHNVALSALLTRRGGQFAVAAGLAAVAWLAGSMTVERPRQPLSPDLAADVAAAAFAAAVAAGAAVALLGGSGDPVAYRWHAAAGVALLGLSAAVILPELTTWCAIAGSPT